MEVLFKALLNNKKLFCDTVFPCTRQHESYSLCTFDADI